MFAPGVWAGINKSMELDRSNAVTDQNMALQKQTMDYQQWQQQQAREQAARNLQGQLGLGAVLNRAMMPPSVAPGGPPGVASMPAPPQQAPQWGAPPQQAEQDANPIQAPGEAGRDVMPPYRTVESMSPAPPDAASQPQMQAPPGIEAPKPPGEPKLSLATLLKAAQAEGIPKDQWAALLTAASPVMTIADRESLAEMRDHMLAARAGQQAAELALKELREDRLKQQGDDKISNTGRRIDSEDNWRRGRLEQGQQRTDAYVLRADTLNEIGRKGLDLKLVKRIAADSGGSGGATSDKYNSDPEYARQVDFWAKTVNNGGTLPGRFAQSVGKQFATDVYSAATSLGGGDANDMLANRVSQREMNSEAQRIGTQSASVSIANKEMQQFIPLAETAVDNVPRTGWRPVNSLIQYGENTWSPEQKAFMIANRAVLNAFSQIIGRGVPTVHSMIEAEKLLNTADSPAVYKAAMNQLRLEGVVAEQGLRDAHKELQGRVKDIGKDAVPLGGNGKPKAPAPAPTAGGAAPAQASETKVINGVTYYSVGGGKWETR